MEQLSEQNLLELYDDTLDKCGAFLLDEDDETNGYNIYEEFDIGVFSFFHVDSLQRLHESGLISTVKFNESSLLRRMVIDLQSTGEWDIGHFRTSDKWREVMRLCDRLKALS